jgi:hypothetical protein
MNYNMMGMSKSLDELLVLLKTAEEDMNKGSENASRSIRSGRILRNIPNTSLRARMREMLK